jgi:hypothetical protein
VTPPITKAKIMIVLKDAVRVRNLRRNTAKKPLNGLSVCPVNVVPKGH